MPVKMSTPREIVQWPPADHIGQVDVSMVGTNWWNLANRFGYENPWDLIIYNFRTEDPREVNWYLEQFVGCYIHDGDNYLFADAAPGFIYLPPPHWRPGGGFKRASGRRDYSRYIPRLTASRLRKAAHVCPTFRCSSGGFFGPSALREFASQIENGKVNVTVMPEMRWANWIALYAYDSSGGKKNTLLLSQEPDIGGTASTAALVHEAVHAWQDRRGKLMFRSDAELEAYAVDAIVYVLMNRRKCEEAMRAGHWETTHGYDYNMIRFGVAALQRYAYAPQIDLRQIESRMTSQWLNPATGKWEDYYAPFRTSVKEAETKDWHERMEYDG